MKLNNTARLNTRKYKRQVRQESINNSGQQYSADSIYIYIFLSLHCRATYCDFIHDLDFVLSSNVSKVRIR